MVSRTCVGATDLETHIHDVAIKFDSSHVVVGLPPGCALALLH